MITPKIIFEDDEILVLDKPFGITVNNSETTVGQITVQDWVEEYLRVPRVSKVPSVPRGETSSTLDTPGTRDTLDTFISRAGIVHRIDKETSGILLAAKTKEAFENMQAQFKERKVNKSYIALAHGKIETPIGEINVPVGRLPWNRKQFGVLAGGREAVTKYKILNIKYQIKKGKKEPLTLLELYPETGRTHQIRVHLKYMNHPIFSDFLYAGRKTSRDDRKVLNRVFLHAAKISFFHPKTNQLVNFESPLPPELQNLVNQLKDN